jgi:hypothetical protein
MFGPILGTAMFLLENNFSLEFIFAYMMLESNGQPVQVPLPQNLSKVTFKTLAKKVSTQKKINRNSEVQLL